MEIEKTIFRMFRRSVNKYGAKSGMLHKVAGSYRPITYKEIGQTVENFGVGLMTLGFEAKQPGAILSHNRPEWAFADLALIGAGGVSVPIYPTLKPPQIEYLLNESECYVIVAENSEQLEKIRQIKGNLPKLRWVVVIEHAEGNKEDWLLTFEEVVQRGAAASPALHDEFVKRGNSTLPNDLVSIVYTSGTTGIPKGVMLSNRNFMSNIEGILEIYELSPKDVALSFLPLSHILERTGGYYLLIACGVTIGYAESIEKVPDNLREVNPTIAVSVPRLYEKMYSKVLDQVSKSSKIKQLIFHWALKVGKEHFAAKQSGDINPLLVVQHRLADLLVYSTMREKLGGRLRFFISGGAPLEPSIAEFFASCNVMIYEGYGLTETSPVTNVNRPNKIKFGTVGPTIPCVEVKIAEDGEILVRGPNVMLGYYKKPEDTAEVMTADGWFKTGDIGVIDPDGFLKITDRKKELLVTSGGKNVAPQPLENMFKTSRFIGQIMVIGDRRKFISALIVPNFEQLEGWLKEKGVKVAGRAELVRLPEVIAFMDEQIQQLQKDVPQYEQIKRFALLDHDLTIDGGELTPTLKLKRKVVTEKYKEIIAGLYPVD